MKIIITGGAGFIGSHLTDILLTEGHEVLIVDDFSYGKKDFLDRSNTRLSIAEGDITNKEFINQVFHAFNPELVFHLAALHHIPTCENKPDIALKINIEGTQQILSACSGITDLKRIVFASSGAVYDIVDEPLIEDRTPTVPYDTYSVSKLSAEYIVRLWAHKFSKQAVVARIFNTIGGRETNAHLVPEIIEQILAGKNTIELGNLEPKRSYIDARDTSAGLYELGKMNAARLFEIVNLGREDEYNVKEIVEMLSEAHGSTIAIEQSAARMRKVDRKKQQASMAKMYELTGWKPKYSVNEGIRYAYDFAKEKRIR
jgi:UDP-glucose 4-epimerase